MPGNWPRFFLSVDGLRHYRGGGLFDRVSFVVLVTNLGSDPSPMPVTELFLPDLLFWLIVLLAAAISPMRLFALEKLSGTFETLMTSRWGICKWLRQSSRRRLFFTSSCGRRCCHASLSAAFHKQPAHGSGHDWRDVSGRLSSRLPVFVAGLLCSALTPEPDGGGDDQFSVLGVICFHSDSG